MFSGLTRQRVCELVRCMVVIALKGFQLRRLREISRMVEVSAIDGSKPVAALSRERSG